MLLASFTMYCDGLGSLITIVETIKKNILYIFLYYLYLYYYVFPDKKRRGKYSESIYFLTKALNLVNEGNLGRFLPKCMTILRKDIVKAKKKRKNSPSSILLILH